MYEKLYIYCTMYIILYLYVLVCTQFVSLYEKPAETQKSLRQTIVTLSDPFDESVDLWTWYSHNIEDLGPYTERIDLCFEPFFVKEIRRVIE
jgi:hypothetical protein